MVIGPDFVWAHMPKTGGTSVVEMFGLVDNSLDIDAAHDNVLTHDTFAVKEARTGIDLSGKQRLLNIRRLPAWIISFANYTRDMSPVPKKDLLCGKVHCVFPLDDITIVDLSEAMKHHKQYFADDLLKQYICGRVDHWLRTEHLAKDFISCVSEFISIAPEQRRQLNKLRLNVQTYDRNIRSWFRTKRSLKRLYDLNPVWAELERELYGSLPYETMRERNGVFTVSTSRCDPRTAGSRACSKFVS